MNETLAGALVVGAVFGLLGAVVMLIRKLIGASSEGARRLRIVLGVVVLLIIGYVLIAMFGIGGTLAIFAVVATITWIVRGFKNKT